MTGDAETQVEKSILQSGEKIEAQILKIAHHGSKSSTSKEFLDYIKPTYALISCGIGNRYNHPHKETIDRLDNKNIKIFRTDKMGTVVVEITLENICFLWPVEIYENMKLRRGGMCLLLNRF